MERTKFRFDRRVEVPEVDSDELQVVRVYGGPEIVFAPRPGEEIKPSGLSGSQELQVEEIINRKGLASMKEQKRSIPQSRLESLGVGYNE